MRLIKWLPLFVTNLFSVFNDNYLKFIISFIAIKWVAEDDADLIRSLAAGLLVIPFILFSPIAGKLSILHRKKKILVYCKFSEIPIMLIAFAGFYFQNIYIVSISLFLMGIQSAILSPAKYGLIRDIEGKKGISFGTGTMEMITFFAILMGTFLAGVTSDYKINPESNISQLLIISATIISISILGWISSITVKAKESKPLESSKDSSLFWIYIKDSYKYAKTIKGLNYVIASLATFWMIGGMLQLNILKHGKEILKIEDSETSLITGYMAISIAIGCIITGLVSKKKIRTGLITIGGIGLSLSLTSILIFKPTGLTFTALLMAAAYFAGIFKVPLNSWIQDKVKGRKLGDVLAYLNIIVFIFVFIATGLYYLFASFFDSYIVFAVITFISWTITIISTKNIPRVFNRFKMYILVFIVKRKVLLKRLNQIKQ